MSLPNTQALNSPTFTRPPLELIPNLTLPELYDWNGQHSPNHPLFIFDHPEDGGRVETIVWKDAVAAIHRAAHYVAAQVALAGKDDSTRRPVVAILASADTITYLCLIIGTLRANFAVFPISPRNTAEGIAHLLTKTGTTHFIVSDEPANTALVTSTLELVQDNVIRLLPMLSYGYLFPPPNSAGAATIHFPKQSFNMDEPSLISHSSGSCAFPKPITWNHGALVQLAYAPYFGEIDLCGLVVGIHAVPMFHGMGHTQMLMAASTGNSLAVFKPESPPIIPTPTNVLAGIVASKTDLTGSVPAFIETWSKDPAKVEVLKSLKGLIYGGGPLNKELGDGLASQGVKIYGTYASTEVGLMSTYFREENPGMDWEYFSFSGHVRSVLLQYGQSPNIAEVIIKPHTFHQCAVINTSIHGQNAYATNDLLTPHPIKKGFYKVYGRADDQIMLSTGEKTNPGPLEAILNMDPRVRGSLVFGRSQFQNGVLVDPTPENLLDETCEESVEKYRDAIWPSIEKLNAAAPTHSRIFKEMIIVTSRTKPLIYTAKGTIRRQPVLDMYEPEIKAVYVAVASHTGKKPPSPFVPPANWSFDSTVEFVKAVVWSVMTVEDGCPDEADLFQHGCDSLQATWIRNNILRGIRETAGVEAAQAIPDSVVYEHPTIRDLSLFISQIVSPSLISSATKQHNDVNKRVLEVVTMIEKYSSTFAVDRYEGSSFGDGSSQRSAMSSQVDVLEQQMAAAAFTVTLLETSPKRVGFVKRAFAALAAKMRKTNRHKNVPKDWSSNFHFFPQPKPKTHHSPPYISSSFTRKDVIVVTGTTRGLGARLLHQFIHDDNVSRIYAINRRPRNGRTLAENQLEALGLTGHDMPAKVTLLQADLALNNLGLESCVFEEIRQSVTHIVHNGWSVDFKMSLASFESQIQGLKHLINLALSSPNANAPRLLFVSTIGIFQHPDNMQAPIPETHIQDPRMVIGMGYSEAKYVCEQLLAKAERETRLRPIVVRLGQICGGGGEDGHHWNEKEWFPSIVGSAAELGCLPAIKSPLSWVSSQYAARALTEMRDSQHSVLHLVHPRQVSCTTLMQPLASALNVPLVPYSDWLNALAQNAASPASILLPEFKKMVVESVGSVDLQTSLAVQSSNTLKTMPSLGEEDVNKWIGAWRKTGFVPVASS